jgi:RimK family alpha-L-glutamate ligase
MDGWIIYEENQQTKKMNALDWMKEEANKAGLNVEIMFLEYFSIAIIDNKFAVFYKGEQQVELPKFVLFRCYDLVLANQLDKLGVKVFNKPEAMENSLNKWFTHRILAENKIKTPNTIHLCSSMWDYSKIKKVLGIPFIVKEIIGSKGEGVYLINDEDSFNNLQFKLKNKEVIFQEFIQSSYGRDIRVYVVGDNVVGAVIRKSETDFRSNFSLGGEAIPFELDEKIKNIAIQSTRAANLDIAGVDLLFGENDDVLVCEINSNAGFRTLYSCYKTNVPREIMLHIKKCLD